MTPADTYLYIRQQNDRRKDDFNLLISTWKVIRWVGAVVYNANARKGKGKSPDKLLKLPGEIRDKKPLMSKEQFEKAKRKFDKVIKMYG